MHDQGALSEPCDARQDLIGAFRPDERLAGGIAGVEELPDGGLQPPHAPMRPTFGRPIIGTSCVRGTTGATNLFTKLQRQDTRPLQHTGPHHSQRGPSPRPLSTLGGVLRDLRGHTPQEPGTVARLVTCLSSSRSMLSGTPGGRGRACRSRTPPHGLRLHGKDRHPPTWKVLGATGQIQGTHPSPRDSRGPPFSVC